MGLGQSCISRRPPLTTTPPHTHEQEKPGEIEMAQSLGSKIQITIVSGSGVRVTAALLETTSFTDLFTTYANRVGAEVDTLSFTYQGAVITPTQSPADLGMAAPSSEINCDFTPPDVLSSPATDAVRSFLARCRVLKYEEKRLNISFVICRLETLR